MSVRRNSMMFPNRAEGVGMTETPRRTSRPSACSGITTATESKLSVCTAGNSPRSPTDSFPTPQSSTRNSKLT
jgi:hypothetical protein